MEVFNYVSYDSILYMRIGAEDILLERYSRLQELKCDIIWLAFIQPCPSCHMAQKTYKLISEDCNNCGKRYNYKNLFYKNPIL